ncbi:hemagglutinin repeat-containing protein [Herbaspirillum sp. LeCh32-8]|uniref:hemagglutinin repeat-containing protein n=1 Tax=Herbaspirillum sp. LeCh32-8 TaxID=2821356 RepID=UPI001AE78873|nr:hemagglutinin repeat-containing protein [Herbaspirillum sp. LeCh32-8]MBP0597389.1 hemagglutinin repeat-containing protein [Herbaspirillum sp. LeCh32-8]
MTLFLCANRLQGEGRFPSIARGINIVAATDIFSGGGLGVTVGSKMQSNAQTRTTATASGSTVGTTNGNVILTAGQHYTQTASTVIAPQGDVAISGKQVDITAGINTEQNTQETKSKEQGVTVQITNPVVSAVQTVMSMQDVAQKYQEQPRQDPD